MQKNTINSNGFTLLELLIAIAVFAAILAVLYPSYTGTFRNIEAAESQSEIYHMARVALERMTEDLQSAYITRRPANPQTEGNALQPAGFLGQDGTLNGRDADGLNFMSEEHITFNTGDRKGRGRIVYYVKEREGKDTFILYRSDTLELGNLPEEETGGFIIFDNLYSINFKYTDDKGETHDSWDSSSETFKDKLPVTVSIQIEAYNQSDPESPTNFMTSISLPMAGNNI